MIISCRSPTQPPAPAGSSLSRGSRNHSTSIGAPNVRGRSPAAPRTVESRPSQATTRPARSSCSAPVGPVAVADADDPALLVRQPGHLRVAAEGERGLSRRGVRQQLEEVPLRDQGDVLVRPRQPAQVGDGEQRAADVHLAALDPPLRQRGEPLPQPELVQQGQRGGVHRVAAEVAQEVGVLLEHRDRYPGPRQQQTQHQARGATPDDDATGALGHASDATAALFRPSCAGRSEGDALNAAGVRLARCGARPPSARAG